MECITWFVPIVPGKLEEWKAFDAELRARHGEFAASRQRLGLVREVASLMQTPQGDFVCLFHEGDDLRRSFALMATSDDPFDAWFRGKLIELHGLAGERLQGDLPATLYFDHHPDG